MKYIFTSLIFCIGLTAKAQNDFPRSVTIKTGEVITIYQPQPETLDGDKLTGRAAVSVKSKSTEEPLFGAMWFEAGLETDRDSRMAKLTQIKITNAKLPGVDDSSKIQKWKKTIETEIPNWDLDISIDKLIASIEEEQQTTSENFNTAPPKIIYTTKVSTLVLIDGEPKIEKDDNLKMNRVINTAYLIVQNPDDKKYYLYGGNFWYQSSSINEGWIYVKALPKQIQELDKQIKEQQSKNSNGDASQTTNTDKNQTPPQIIVSTQPAELIQSNGEADFKTVQGTSLLYVANSDDDIFMDVNSQKYFVLLTGRWFTSSALNSGWKYIAADKLPSDFQKIPEGSEKDGVLSSVAGTDAAKEAVMDAQIPQTAKVDREKATCTVKYDGDPKFEKIEGTDLYLAMNTSSTVLRSNNKYFCVENGVWFQSANATGPWIVSTERPSDVDKIPPKSPAYNVQYVYIYETTPQYVYVGYTPGYMGCYVYGTTIIYGTGYYYSPWYGAYYYPRPVTYGFSMHYNPWTGWSFGYHVSYGWFHFSVHAGRYPGYWGPPVYRPPYYPPYRGGFYGPRPIPYRNVNVHGDVNINVNRTNNIYNYRKDVTTNDIKRNPPNNGNKSNPTALPANKNANNVFADKNGNVFQKNDKGWQQRDNNQWKPASDPQQLPQQQQMRDRGDLRAQNFNQTNGGGNLGGNYNKPSATVKKPSATNTSKKKKS